MIKEMFIDNYDNMIINLNIFCKKLITYFDSFH